MKITQEADYALRICSLLSLSTKPVGAPQVAEEVHIPPRFAMKILRKLSIEGIVKATRGVSGGYSLRLEPESLRVRQVIEAIDGKIEIRKCLCESNTCSHNPDKSLCRFHKLFEKLNEQICERLDRVTLGMMTSKSLPMETVLEIIK